MKLSDFEEAVYFVSSGSMYGDHSAVLKKSTGEIFFASEMSDLDEMPEDAYESDDWLEIPHKNDLDLGRALVFDFVMQFMPSYEDRIHRMFSRRGAYGQFKDFLDEKGMLQEWFDFEREQTLKAIKEWCHDNELEITE